MLGCARVSGSRQRCPIRVLHTPKGLAFFSDLWPLESAALSRRSPNQLDRALEEAGVSEAPPLGLPFWGEEGLWRQLPAGPPPAFIWSQPRSWLLPGQHSGVSGTAVEGLEVTSQWTAYPSLLFQLHPV